MIYLVDVSLDTNIVMNSLRGFLSGIELIDLGGFIESGRIRIDVELLLEVAGSMMQLGAEKYRGNRISIELTLELASIQ